MTVLTQAEYDQHYFDGILNPPMHPAGYSEFVRWYRTNSINSSGEFWKDMAIEYNTKYSLVGKRVLEIGCAKGYLVEDLRSLGVNAYGIDISSYAIEQASLTVKPYLTIGDARTSLSAYNNNYFDVIISTRFLVCLDPLDIPSLVTQMNRVSRLQVHIVDENPNPDYYTSQTIAWWRSTYAFEKGAIIVSQETKQYLVK